MRLVEIEQETVVDEDMVWSDSKLACFVPPEGNKTAIVLYKAWNPMKHALMEYNGEAVEDNILGSIEIYDRGAIDAVGRVAAEKGYGPLLYYMMMTYHGWLAPHAHDTSPQAIKIWQKFFQMNTKKKLLSPELDKENPLSYAYGLPSELRVKVRNTLRQTRGLHEAFMNKIVSESSHTKNELETTLWETASVDYLHSKLRSVYG